MRTTDQFLALNIYGDHGLMDLDAKQKAKPWKRRSYASWKKNEERARKFRENLKTKEH